MADLALADVRVLDFTWYIAGPYCTKLLADYGADVIKVERPGLGDPSRRMGPFPQDVPNPEKSGLFLHLNTNKRGITLNLKTALGRRIAEQLARRADVVVESFSPGVMASLGLGYAALEKLNHAVVMTSVSNFGQTGPYRDFQMSELVLSAMGTSMKTCGQPDREPLKLAGNLLQYQAGVVAAAATMMTLFAGKIAGVGQHVDLSLMETCLASMDRRAASLLGYQYTGDTGERVGSSRGGSMAGCPDGVYPCKDGYFDIVGGAAWWPRNLALLGSPPQLADQRFGTVEGQMDPANQAQILAVLYPWASERTKRDVWEDSGRARAAAAPLYTMEEVASDPNFCARASFTEIAHPRAGCITFPGASFRPTETPWQLRRPAPLLGEHNEEVYADLGYTRDELLTMRAANVI